MKRYTNTILCLGFHANNYTLTVATTKTNYIATLDEVGTQISATPNDGPIPLIGATSMYPGLLQIVSKPPCSVFTRSSFLAIYFIRWKDNYNHWILPLPSMMSLYIFGRPRTSIRSEYETNDCLSCRYSNSTVQIIIDFIIAFPTSCASPCINQRNSQLTNQLRSLNNTSVQIQPSNLTDGQVRLIENGISTLHSYSLTTQVIANFSGTIINAVPPTFTIIYWHWILLTCIFSSSLTLCAIQVLFFIYLNKTSPNHTPNSKAFISLEI